MREQLNSDIIRQGRKGKLFVLTVFLVVLAISILLNILKANGPVEPSPKISAPVRAPQTSFCGVTLQLHTGWDENPFEHYIDQIAATGANVVSFVLPSYQENAGSTSIFIDLRKAPNDRRLLELMAYAHGRGLQVAMMPVVLLENPRQDEWRGKISPEDWDTWWDNYRNIVIRYAKLAQWGQADLYTLGSELVSTEAFTGKWRKLIADVRKIYNGKLCYSANWDHFRPIEWWDALDVVGMTSYYDLTGGEEPTIEHLLKAWKPIKADILDWQAKIGKRILFTEVGWPNQDTCAQYPWNYYSSTKPDPEAQANCFEAFFQTWVNEPAIEGFLVWEWQSYPQQTTGVNDIGYVPIGKPAMKVIEKYYSAKNMIGDANIPTRASGPSPHHRLGTTAQSQLSDKADGPFIQADNGS